MNLAVFSLLLLLIICPGNNSNQTEDAAPAREGLMNQELKVRVGENILLRGEDLKVRFVSVLEDSRCPKGEQCITAGNGKIQLQRKKSKKGPVTLELNSSSGTQEAYYEGYVIKFVQLDPYPKMGNSIKPTDYVVTILVNKTASSSVSSAASM